MKPIPIPTSDKIQLVIWIIAAIAAQILAHLGK
jgi:hypothetical protein